MDYRFTIKRLGNTWYLDIDHNDPYDIMFNKKLSKVFTMYDKYGKGQLELNLIEIHSIIFPETMFFNEQDLLTYFTTTDSFDVRFMVDDHEFSISSEMYNLVEYLFNPNFHKTCYKVDIRNWTI